MGGLRIGVTQRELKFVTDMLECTVRFVKPRSFNGVLKAPAGLPGI